MTCSSGNAVRLWSVVNVSEIKHAAQHPGNGSALGVTMEDEMTLDAPASSASFDDTLDMVTNLSSDSFSSLFNLFCYYYHLLAPLILSQPIFMLTTS